MANAHSARGNDQRDLTAKGGDGSEFRGYLVQSDAAAELVKVLVGLEEADPRPEDPVKFLADYFASQELAPITKQRVKEDLEAVQGENARLHAQVAELEAGVSEAQARLEQRDRDAQQPLVEGLMEAHIAEGAVGEAPRLDLSKLYAALRPRLPEGEGAPWCGEEFAAPEGVVPQDALEQWAYSCFGTGTPMAAKLAGLSLGQFVLACKEAPPPPENVKGAAQPEPEEPLEMEAASKVFDAMLEMCALARPASG